MLSTVAVIGICVAVSVSFLFTGSILAVWLLRIRDRRRIRLTSSISRGLSTYRRAHLSIDGSNYSHIQQPRTSVRRSGQRPYGIVTESSQRRTEVASQESLRPQQMTSIEEQPEIDEMVSIPVPIPKRFRSLRQTLHGNNLNIPKTRRRKKTEKVIAQSSMPLSPLSAITELTDPSESTIPNVADHPTSISPIQTPEKLRNGEPYSRPVSIQWPLPLAVRRSKNTPATAVTSIPVRDSILIRKGSMDNTIQSKRPGFGRSISTASVMSDAPAGPLPPLPLRNVQRSSQQNYETTRCSNASLDTIGSSVLGSIPNSPTRTATYNSATPNINLSSPGLHQFSPASARGSHSAITVGTATGKRAQQGTVSASGTHSFRASINEQASVRNFSNDRTVDRSDQRFKGGHLFDDSLRTIDARNWRPDLPARSVSYRTTLSPSFPVPVARKPGDNAASARHSMFEPQVSVRKRASNPVRTSAGEILTGSPQQLAHSRPISAASEDRYQWDLRPPSSLILSPLHLKKGHKRQNCARISNLPAVVPTRNSKLPEMMEEEEEQTVTPGIPGLTLLEVENGTPGLRARASLVDIKASPSPFHKRPLLELTSRRRTSGRPTGAEFQGIARPDSDVFTNSLSGPTTSTIFDGRRSARNWPLSPTPPNNIKLNSTPPPLSAIEEPREPDNAMLLLPAMIGAAAHFPRKSGVPQGPRTAPVSARNSRNASPSPLTGRTVPKPKGDELHRSVMMLRQGMIEGKPLEATGGRLYRNMGEQSVSNFSLLNTSHSNLALACKTTGQMHGYSSTSDRHRGSNMAWNSMIGMSRSKMSMATSPSTMSIWDDASVCDEVDLEMRNSMLLHVPEQTTLGGHDPEAYENFVGQGEQQYMGGASNEWKDREREGRLTSPQGRGLGISDWGTPGSLYDQDGFLKEQ